MYTLRRKHTYHAAVSHEEAVTRGLGHDEVLSAANRRIADLESSLKSSQHQAVSLQEGVGDAERRACALEAELRQAATRALAIMKERDDALAQSRAHQHALETAEGRTKALEQQTAELDAGVCVCVYACQHDVLHSSLSPCLSHQIT